MAPNVPAEIDVFTVPHSRMKELVNIYATKVQDVDYRNCQEVGTLLKELQLTLHEFKYHESIENMFIMDQLKNRLKQRHIYNSAVCDCHNDNRINQMMTLVKNGKHLWKTSIGERLSYGHELQKAFIEFVQKFLPHMEEEENIFQPLLVEHFEYDELCVLKELVLEQHELIKDPLYQEKAELDDMPETDIAIKEFRDLEDNALSLTGLYGTLPEYCESKYCDILPETETHGQSFDKNIVSNLVDDKEEIEDIISCKGIPSLPSEILIKIFSYLMPPDRGRCAQVCSIWNELVYSKPLWKIIYPIQWARGIWNLEDMNLNHAFQEEMSKKQLPCIKQDEDADIDESDNDSLDPISQMENDFFVSLITYLLPRVGLGVEKIILDGSQGLSGRLIQQALQLCPNVLHISAAYTFFDYYSLKGLHLLGGLRKLKYLDLEGCEYVDDNTLAALAESLRPLSDINPSNQCYSRNCPFLNNSSIAPCLNDPRLCPYNSTVPACAYSSSKFKSVSQGNLTSNEERLMNCSYNDFNNSEIEELYNICDYTNDSSYDLWEQNFRLSNIDNPEPTLEKINLSGCWQVTNSGLLSLLNSYALKNLKSLNLSSCFNLSGEVLLSIASNCDKLRPENLTYCCNISNGPYTSQANGCDSIDHPLKVCCRSLYKS